MTSCKLLNLSESQGCLHSKNEPDRTQPTELPGRSKESTSVTRVRSLPSYIPPPTPETAWRTFRKRGPQVVRSQKVPGRHLQLPSHQFKNRDHKGLHQPESQLLLAHHQQRGRGDSWELRWENRGLTQAFGNRSRRQGRGLWRGSSMLGGLALAEAG